MSTEKFINDFTKILEHSRQMSEGKVKSCRKRLLKACGSNDALKLAATLWLETCMGQNDIVLDDPDEHDDTEIQRFDIKRLASKAGISKRDTHATLFLIAQSLPCTNPDARDYSGDLQ